MRRACAVCAWLLVVPGTSAVAQEAQVDVPLIGTADLAVVVQGGWGEGPGEFGKLPEEGIFGALRYVIDPNGDFILVDGGRNRRLQVFNREGEFVRVIPLPTPAMPSALAPDRDGRVYLTDGRDLHELALATGEYRSLGRPPELLGGIQDLAVAPAEAQEKLFLQQGCATWEDEGPCVHAYDLELRHWGGLRGGSPVVTGSGTCTLYVVGSRTVTAGGTEVTLKYWSADEREVRSIALPVPVKVGEKSWCGLIGATTHPLRLYLLANEPAATAKGSLWAFSAEGELLGGIMLAPDFPQGPIAWDSIADRFAVDEEGNLYISWADPDKGYYIGRLSAEALGR